MSKLQQATVGMIIYLGRLLPAASSNLPKAGGPRQRFCSVLLRMGFTYAPSVTREAVVSYTALPPLPGIYRAVYFCCTILRVASTGRYPASCPVQPGLSSPRYSGRDHMSYINPSFVFRHILPAWHPINYTLFFLFVQAWFSYFLLVLPRQGFFHVLHIKTRTADKFTDNGILPDSIRRHRKEIIQEL